MKVLLPLLLLSLYGCSGTQTQAVDNNCPKGYKEVCTHFGVTDRPQCSCVNKAEANERLYELDRENRNRR